MNSISSFISWKTVITPISPISVQKYKNFFYILHWKNSTSHFSLDGKVYKRSSRHECRPLCPPSDSGGKSELDADALLHAAVGGRPFTSLPHRMSAFPPTVVYGPLCRKWTIHVSTPQCAMNHPCGNGAAGLQPAKSIVCVEFCPTFGSR